MQHQSLVSLKAPEFAADAVVFKNGVPELGKYSLHELLAGGHYGLIVFYPRDFTFVCPTEIHAFSDAAEQFEKEAKCRIAFVSTDSIYSHFAWASQARREGGIQGVVCPLVADSNHAISRAYGVLLPEAGAALRGLFVVSDKGVVRAAHVNDLPIGRSVDEALRIVKACRFTDENGEVCPVNFRGGAAIKPTLEGARHYFAAEGEKKL